MARDWMMSWQPFFPSHSLGPDFMECVYVQVRGDAPQFPPSASNPFMTMQMSPKLSDSNSSHLPYLSRCLGEFNQVKLNELTDLLWRYHLTSNPRHLTNNSNEVGASSQVQDTDRQKLDCSLCQAFQDQDQVHPGVAVTFTSVTPASTQIAKLQWRREQVNTCLAFHRKDSLLGRTEKGNCWFQVKDSTLLPSHLHNIFPQSLKWPAEPTPWRGAAGLRENLISFNRTFIFSDQKWHFLPLPLFSAAAQKSWHLPSAWARLCLWSWNPSSLAGRIKTNEKKWEGLVS